MDKGYWETHWQQARAHGAEGAVDPNPYLERELRGLVPGSALDAGCGEGAEAIWLAAAGWRVTAADISAAALARAADRASSAGSAAEGVHWIEADLSAWQPGRLFDLVATHYAHPAMPQLAFYERLAGWVAPGGTLLIVGHLDTGATSGHGHGPPGSASVTAAAITAGLDADQWVVVTADEPVRSLASRAGSATELHDVVVHARRRP